MIRRALLLSACIVGAVVVIVILLQPRDVVMRPTYRFVDPSLRPDMREGVAPGTAANPVLASGETSGLPTATVMDETRYVLASPPHDALLYNESFPASDKGYASLAPAVPPRLLDARRLVLVPQIRREGKTRWVELPTRLVSTNQVGEQWQAAVDLPLPPDVAGTKIGLQIEAYAVSQQRSRTYRTPEVRVPDNAYLECGIGILKPAWSQGPVLFELKACAGETCELLLSETMDPAKEDDHGWRDLHVTLRTVAHTRSSFVFETTLLSGDPNAWSFPLWANPTVYAPVRRHRDDVNVILLSIDTLAAAHLPSYGYKRDTTPFIADRFGKNGTIFDHCVAAAATTPPSHMSMFTSVQPCVHRLTTGYEVLSPTLVTVAETLRGVGVETGAITDDGWLGVQYGFGRGFNEYAEQKSGDIMLPKGQVDVTVNKAQQWLTRHRDRQFFLFLHTFEVHDPYTPPAKYDDLFTDYDGRLVTETSPRALRDLANYDREIRYTDDQLRLLFQSLETEGLADRTIFILVADHGEEFFEHGFWGHGAHLYEEVTHVPLMLWGPGRIPAGRRISENVGHIDLMPTILDTLGVAIPPQITGVSLVPLLRGNVSAARPTGVRRPLFSEAWGASAVGPDYGPLDFRRPAYMVQLGERKLMRSPQLEGTGFKYELYDLGTDPGERTDQFAEGGDAAAALRAAVDSYERECLATAIRIAAVNATNGVPTPPRVRLDPGQEEKLRMLGYIK